MAGCWRNRAFEEAGCGGTVKIVLGNFRLLDWRAVGFVTGALLAGWTLLVVVFTWQGQPGVVCLTPVAWLLAVIAGRGTLNFTRTEEPALRRAEAGLAGCLLGLLLGLLFTGMIELSAEMSFQERVTMALFGVALTFFGLLACGVAAYGMAALAERGGEG
jgi:hypothetical protein